MTRVRDALQLLKNTLAGQAQGFLMSGAGGRFWSQFRPSWAGLV